MSEDISTNFSFQAEKSEPGVATTGSIKLVIIGEPRVGKTTLRRSYLGKKFKHNYLPTLGADFSYIKYDYGNVKYIITLWDLSGQPKFGKIVPQYYVGSSGAVVVYDVLDDNAELHIINWIDHYLEHSGKFVPIVLIIANKIDLVDPNDEVNHLLKHDELIDKLQIYYTDKVHIINSRTSAKTGENVSSTFNLYFNKIINNLEKSGNLQIEMQLGEIDKYIPASYLISFDEYLGPKIITKSPIPTTGEYTDGEENSVVRTFATLDFEDVVDQTYITGNITWIKPKSTFYFIAFALKNSEMRGGYELLVAGFNLDRKYKNAISTSQELIEGKLHGIMNSIVHLYNKYDYNILDEEEFLQMSIESDYKMEKLLLQLRWNAYKIVKDHV